MTNKVNDRYIQMAIKSNLNLIALLNQEIELLEKTVKQKMALKPTFKALLTYERKVRLYVRNILIVRDKSF